MLKELIKDLLFYNFVGMINEYDENFSKLDQEFNYIKFSNDRKEIIFSAIVEETYGGDCDDSEHHTKKKYIRHLNQYQIEEPIKNLLIEPHEFHHYKIDIDNDEISHRYFDNYKEIAYFYINEETSFVNQDYYSNGDTVRVLNIPIEEIVEYIISFEFKKPLVDMEKSLSNLSLKDYPELYTRFSAIKLDDELLEKTVNNKIKVKI